MCVCIYVYVYLRARDREMQHVTCSQHIIYIYTYIHLRGMYYVCVYIYIYTYVYLRARDREMQHVSCYQRNVTDDSGTEKLRALSDDWFKCAHLTPMQVTYE